MMSKQMMAPRLCATIDTFPLQFLHTRTRTRMDIHGEEIKKCEERGSAATHVPRLVGYFVWCEGSKQFV